MTATEPESDLWVRLLRECEAAALPPWRTLDALTCAMGFVIAHCAPSQSEAERAIDELADRLREGVRRYYSLDHTPHEQKQ